MKPYSHIMVSLDLTNMDLILIGFVCQFIKINPYVKQIYFIHVERDLEEYHGERDELLVNKIPSDEEIRMHMEEEVKKCYHGNEDIRIRYKIVEGNTLHQLLHWSRIKNIDLIIAGKKKPEKGKGVVMEKLARKSHCSILFVPPNHSPELKDILIPTDFTEETDHALEVACELAKQLPDATFWCQNVVEVPHGYTKIGKTYEEFSEIMVQNAERRWEKYRTKHHFDTLTTEPVFTLKNHDSIAKNIFSYAKDIGADMIIMGSKEQTDAAVFILGSVAEEVVTYDYDILLLLVKQHGKEYDFFRAIKKL